MTTVPHPILTEAEYLALDLASAERNEFYNGEVVTMAGADPVHCAVVTAASRALSGRLRDRPCMTFSENQRVRVDETGLYAYPALVVACAPLAFAPTTPPTLLNPRVVIEVLSPSTETTDRGAKFAHFQHPPSVTDYVLVTPNTRRVEHFRRLDDDRWVYAALVGDAALELESLGLSIPLAELYEDAEKLARLTAKD